MQKKSISNRSSHKVILPVLAIITVFSIFNIAQAQEPDESTMSNPVILDAPVATGTSVTMPVRDPAARTLPVPTYSPNAIKERIRTDLDRVQNIKNNQDVRNQILENNLRKSSTTPGSTRYDLEKNIQRLPPNRPASTSPMVRKDGYENNGKAMVLNILKERKELLAKQLEVAMRNLTDLRKRIGTRIEKDRLVGKDLSSVRILLEIADSKLSLAKQAVNDVRAYTPSNTDTSATASTTKVVNLDQIRTLVEKARNAIKEAHRALVNVVVAIAKISGTNPRTASTTPSTSATPGASTTPIVSITPVASTTPIISITPTPQASTTPTASTTNI